MSLVRTETEAVITVVMRMHRLPDGPGTDHLPYAGAGPQSVEEIGRLFARNILGGLAHGPAEDAALDELITRTMDTVRRAPGRLAPPIKPPALIKNV